MRAGETMGLDVRSINFKDSSLWITQTIQRVSEEALSKIPKDEIIRIFPKQKDFAKSLLILKTPKTDDSERKLFLNAVLIEEIRHRILFVLQQKKKAVPPNLPEGVNRLKQGFAKLLTGLEPVTSSLPRTRASCCAIEANKFFVYFYFNYVLTKDALYLLSYSSIFPDSYQEFARLSSSI